MKRTKKLIAIGAPLILVLGLIPVKMQGQWAVFDGSSYAALGKIWSSDATTYAKIVQEFQQLVKIYQTDMATYQMAVAMSQMLSQPQRLAMLVKGPAVLNNFTQSRYEETASWSSVMNGGSGGSNAWNRSTVSLSGDPYLALEKVGSSVLVAHLASTEAVDGASQKCMQVLSQYRSNQAGNQNAIALLKKAGLDISPGINSIVAQLNLQNMAAQQAMAEKQSQGSMQACLAEQQMLANKQQRDEMVESLNMLGDFTNAQNSTYSAMGPMGKQNAWLIP